MWLLCILIFVTKRLNWSLAGRLRSFPGGTSGKEPACNAGDLGSICGWGGSPGEGLDNPLQSYCLENPWTEELGRLQSMGLHRVRHDQSDSTGRLRAGAWRRACFKVLNACISPGSHCNAFCPDSPSGNPNAAVTGYVKETVELSKSNREWVL